MNKGKGERDTDNIEEGNPKPGKETPTTRKGYIIQGVLSVGVILFILFIMPFIGKVFIGISEDSGEVIKEVSDAGILRDFNKGSEVEFTLTDKTVGELSNRMRSWRVNYLTLEANNKEYIVTVDKEFYERYRVGDTLLFYVDKEMPQVLIHESDKIVSIVD